MGQTKDQLGNHAQRPSSAKIQRDVRETRSEMDTAIDELVARLNPGELLAGAINRLFSTGRKGRRRAAEKGGQAMEAGKKAGRSAAQAGRRAGQVAADAGRTAGSAVGQAGSAIIRKVQENPLPAALMAAGAAWFFLSDRDDEEPQARYDATGHDLCPPAPETVVEWDEEEQVAVQHDADLDDSPGDSPDDSPSRRRRAAAGLRSVGQKVSEGARGAAGKVRQTRQGVAAKAQQAGQGVRERATAAGRSAAAAGRRGAGAAASGVRTGARWSRDRYQAALEEQPLAVGAAAMGLGLLCGALIPQSRREHALFGARRDAMRDELRGRASDAVERGEEIAAATMEATQEKAAEEGLTPAQLAEKAGHVATTARESAEQDAHDQGLTPRDLQKSAERTVEHARETAERETRQHREETRGE